MIYRCPLDRLPPLPCRKDNDTVSFQEGSCVWISRGLSNEWVTSRQRREKGGGVLNESLPAMHWFSNFLHLSMNASSQRSILIGQKYLANYKGVDENHNNWCPQWWKLHFWALNFNFLFLYGTMPPDSPWGKGPKGLFSGHSRLLCTHRHTPTLSILL